jgi:hypothetical protein
MFLISWCSSFVVVKLQSALFFLKYRKNQCFLLITLFNFSSRRKTVCPPNVTCNSCKCPLWDIVFPFRWKGYVFNGMTLTRFILHHSFNVLMLTFEKFVKIVLKILNWLTYSGLDVLGIYIGLWAVQSLVLHKTQKDSSVEKCHVSILGWRRWGGIYH